MMKLLPPPDPATRVSRETVCALTAFAGHPPPLHVPHLARGNPRRKKRFAGSNSATSGARRCSRLDPPRQENEPLPHARESATEARRIGSRSSARRTRCGNPPALADRGSFSATANPQVLGHLLPRHRPPRAFFNISRVRPWEVRPQKTSLAHPVQNALKTAVLLFFIRMGGVDLLYWRFCWLANNKTYTLSLFTQSNLRPPRCAPNCAASRKYDIISP